jgi:HK97 family phage prohead protease
MRIKRDRPTKVKRTFQGMLVHVERPAGSTVKWTDADGNEHEQLWFCDYGYFPGKPSVDGDSLDTFLGWHEDAPDAYVVHQLKDGKPDQPKVMLGFKSAKEAKSVFDAHRWPGAFGGMSRLSVESLRAQLENWTGNLSAESIDFQNEEAAKSAAPKMPPNAKQGFAQLVRSIAVAALAAGSLTPEVRDAILPFTRESAGTDAPTAGPDGLRVRTIHVREVREDAREVDFVASTETVDSYGEIVRQNWRLERFRANPVILFAHDSHSLPIGQSVKTVVEGGALLITVKFATAKANPFAELCFQSVLERTLRGGSVGFKPHSIKWEMHNDVERCVLDDNELFEFSVCPVPSNPDGLAQLESRMMAALKTLSAAPAAPKPTTKQEGRVPIKRTIDDAGAADLRSRGMCKVKCDCGVEVELESPAIAKMAEESKAHAEKNATLSAELDAVKKAAEEDKRKATIEKRSTEVNAELKTLVDEGKLLVDDVEDLVSLAIEKPERYAKRVEQIRERDPINVRGPDLTQRPNLGAEPEHQRGSTEHGTSERTFDATDFVNRATSDTYAKRNTDLGFAQSHGTPFIGATSTDMVSFVNGAG